MPRKNNIKGHGREVIPRHMVSDFEYVFLIAALEEFLTKGLGQVTVSQIATKAGTSKQRALYHYGSIDDILLRLTRLWGDVGRQVTIEHLAKKLTPTPDDKVIAMAEAVFIWMENYPEIARLTPMIAQASGYNKEIALLYQSTMQIGVERVKDMIAGKKAMKRKSTVDQLQIAQGIHFLMLGALNYALSSGEAMKLHRFREQVFEILKIFLNSLD